MSTFHSLTITAIDQLTPEAVALTFGVPQELSATFSFVAGQYITLKANVNGQEVRRAYSISSAPASGQIRVGIKKVPNGTFSVYANETLKVGDVLEVLPPEGRFVYQVQANTTANVAAFASGSGITPIMSIAQSVLATNDSNTFLLVYGNKSPEQSMYLQELKALQEQYPNRFMIQWVFSQSNEPNALFGRIDQSVVNKLLKNNFSTTNFDAFYLCGPEQMIQTVADTLKTNGIAEDHIFFELFTTASTATPTTANVQDGQTTITVVLDDEEHSFAMDQKEFVLDAILKKDLDPPYSCQGGVCSSCIAQVVEGKAVMAKNQILTDSEVAEGLILTCQAHAQTPTLKIDFDDV